MSEFEPEYDEKPGPSFYSRDDDSRDVRSREADPANSPEEVQTQVEDDGWKEADLLVGEPENDRDLKGNRRQNSARPHDAEGRPRPKQMRRGKNRQQGGNSSGLESDSKPEGPSHQAKRARGLEHWQNWVQRMTREFMQVLVSRGAQQFIKELLQKTSDAVTDESDCNFLTQAWEFEENNATEKCIQECRNAELDAMYCEELARKRENRDYNEMCAFRENLPAHKMKDRIVQLIEQNQVSFISGGTGCGKTTQIVQFVLDNYIMNMNGSVCNIVCTQPRRVSASSIAERIAAERLEPLSLSVGYQIRFENKLAERKVGCINFVTTGVLLQWMVTSRLLPNVSHIFLDEVHEKTIEFDAIMTLLKTIILERRDLKVILMSATIDSDLFCKYFDGAPDLEIPGYTFPVEDFYLDDILQMTDYTVPEPVAVTSYDPDFEDFEEDVPSLQNLVRPAPLQVSKDLDIPLIAHLIGYICVNEEDGAILVFLPGLSDILRLKKKIEGSPWYSSERHLLLANHSLLPAEVQKDVFVVPPRGKRKIILATSIMETSLTLDEMSYVVDCGMIKFSSFDINLKISTLSATWITRANAKQRRGRVGRTKPGKCYKLYTKDQEDSFIPYPPTDMQMTTLERVILDLKLIKIQEVTPFLEKMMDPPHPVMIKLALTELRKMNALNDNEQLTPLGYHLSKLPLDVRTGKMILMGALFSCIDPIFSIAACLSFKDPFNISLDEDKIMRVKESYSSWEISDHVVLSEILRDWENENLSDKQKFCSEKYLSESNLNQLSDAKRQFARVLHLMNFLPSADVKDPASNVNSRKTELIKAIIYAGLYPSVATLQRNTRNRSLWTLEGQLAQFHGKSLLSSSPYFFSPYFVYFYMLQTSSRIFIHDATMVEVAPLLFFSKGLDIIKIDKYRFLEVDNKLKFHMGQRPARLVKAIKNRLDQILGRALLKSEGINWSQEGKDIEILNGIVNLILGDDITHKVCYLV